MLQTLYRLLEMSQTATQSKTAAEYSMILYALLKLHSHACRPSLTLLSVSELFSYFSVYLNSPIFTVMIYFACFFSIILTKSSIYIYIYYNVNLPNFSVFCQYLC